MKKLQKVERASFIFMVIALVMLVVFTIRYGGLI